MSEKTKNFALTERQILVIEHCLDDVADSISGGEYLHAPDGEEEEAFRTEVKELSSVFYRRSDRCLQSLKSDLIAAEERAARLRAEAARLEEEIKNAEK